MNGLTKITDRIRSDAQTDVNELLAESEKRAADITADYQHQADKILSDAAQRSKKAAAERQEHLISAAEMEKRQMLLRTKQECIDEAFDGAAAQLRKMPRDQYAELLAGMAAALCEGNEEIILSKADAEEIGALVIQKANARKTGAHLTLSNETRELDGGMILKAGKVERNCAFETQLRFLRQNMASEVADILYR